MSGKKINILLDNRGDIYPGWVNVDPLAQAYDPQRVKVSPDDLSRLAHPASLAELRAMEILDYYPARKADLVLAHWLSLLAHGGILTISCVDLMEVSRALQRRLIDMPTANALLHGLQTADWDHRRTNYSLGQLVGVLEGLGMKILTSRIHDYRAIIRAERP